MFCNPAISLVVTLQKRGGIMAKKMLTEYAYKIHLKTIREEGRAEGKAEIVLEMLKENQPLDFISRVSKYSKEKIAEIGRLHGVL